MLGVILPITGICTLVSAFFLWAVKPKTLKQIFAVALGLLVTLALAVLIYSYLGSYQLEAEHQFQLTHANEIDNNVAYFREHPEELMQKLRAQVESRPNELRGWMLLGRVYASAGQYQEASDAFSRAIHIEPNDDGVVLSYLQAKALLGPSSWQAKESQLLLELLNKHPNDPSILHLQASREFTDKQYSQALQHWQQALANLPDNEVDGREAIQEAINRTKQFVTTPLGKQMTVTCDVDAKLATRFTPETTVLIYAKALQGPPMPLAVVKKQLKDLPVTVTLSDRDAMIPGMNLSKFTDIEVFARISQHGQAQPEAGDAIGSLQLHAKNSQESVKIRIQKII